MTHKDALNELQQLVDLEKAEHLKRFFKSCPGEYGEGDKFLSVTVPDQRKIAKKYKDMPLIEVEKLMRSEFHEARLTAVMLLVYRIEKADQFVIDEVALFYLRNIEHVNNWDIVDSSCRFILAKFLEHKERDLLYDLVFRHSLFVNLLEKRCRFEFHFLWHSYQMYTHPLAEIPRWL